MVYSRANNSACTDDQGGLSPFPMPVLPVWCRTPWQREPGGIYSSCSTKIKFCTSVLRQSLLSSPVVLVHKFIGFSCRLPFLGRICQTGFGKHERTDRHFVFLMHKAVNGLLMKPYCQI